MAAAGPSFRPLNRWRSRPDSYLHSRPAVAVALGRGRAPALVRGGHHGGVSLLGQSRVEPHPAATARGLFASSAASL